MAKPWVHARSSARKWGGRPEDYLAIHDLMDSSKSAFPDDRHRALTHNSWFIGPGGILERIFGNHIVVELLDETGEPSGRTREVSVRDIGEQHILEDYGGRFIPTVQDFFAGMEYQGWMGGRKGDGVPPSVVRLEERRKIRRIDFD